MVVRAGRTILAAKDLGCDGHPPPRIKKHAQNSQPLFSRWGVKKQSGKQPGMKCGVKRQRKEKRKQIPARANESK